MLSILIPVYNCDVTRLVLDLHNLCEELKIKFEIVIGDDNSVSAFREINQACFSLHSVRLLQNNYNSGRAIIRNQLAQAAIYPWLLFLDADAQIINSKFIVNYAEYIGENDIVVSGGTAYSANPPEEAELYFRWFYGQKRELKSAQIRMKNPYNSFSTFNFLISAKVFKKVSFNEQIRSYGHEDTLFGLELKNKCVNVYHIQNPAVHVGLDNVTLFLQKSKEGVKNLFFLFTHYPHLFSGKVKLLKAFQISKRLGLSPVMKFFFRILHKKIENNICGKRPSLILFDFYKLLFLFSIK